MKEVLEKLNKEHLDDTEAIAGLRTKCEELCNDFNHADLERNRLRSEIERADSAYAKLAHMYNEKNNSDKKYTEEEIFYLLRRRIITLTDEELKNVIKKLNKQKIIKEQKEKEEKYLDNIRKRISGRSKGLFC